MKIIVKNLDQNIRLRFPTGLVFNRFTTAAISKEAGKYGVKLRPQQVRILIKAMGKYRRAHSGWVLAEVKGAKGEYVQIKL